MARTLLRIAVGALVAVIVLPLVLLQFAPVQDYVLGRALREVNARIPGVVLARSVEGNMLSEIRLEDVRIEHKNRLVGRADSVAVRWNPLALLRGKIAVRSVALSGAFVHLWRDGERWSITAAFAAPATAPSAAVPGEKKGGRPFELGVVRVVGDDLALLVSTAGGDARYRVDHVAGALAVRNEAVAIDLDSLAGASSRPPALVRAASGRASIPLAAPYAWRVDGLEIALRESLVRLDGRASLMPGGDLQFTLAARPAAPADAKPLGSPVRIPIWLQASAKGSWDAVEWQADATSPGGRVALTGRGALPFTAPAAPALGSAWVEARGALEGFSPAAWFGQPQAAGTHLRATLEASARRDAAGALVARASLNGAGSTLGGRRVSELRAEAAYQKRRLEASLVLAAAAGALRGAGVLDVARKSYEAGLTARHVRPEDFFGDAFAGDVNLALSVAGRGFTPESVRAKGRLDVTRSRVAGYAIERMALPVTLGEGRATIRGGALRSPVLDVRLAGQVPLVAGVPANLRVLARAEDLGALLPTTDPAKVVIGRAMVHVLAQGEPDDLRLRGVVHGADMAGRGVALPKLSVTFEAEHVNPAKRTGAVEVLADITNPVYVPYDAESATIALSLKREQEQEASGTFYAAVVEEGKSNEVRGRFVRPGEGLELHLEDVRLYLAERRWANHGEAVIDTRGGSVHIDNLDLRAGDQQIFADGRIDPGGSQNLHLLVNRVDLRMLASLTGRNERVAGELNASAWITGSFADPKFTAAVALTDLAVREYAVQMATGFFTYEARRLEAQVRVRQSRAGGLLRADFDVPLDLSAAAPKGRSRLYEGPLRGEIIAEEISLAIAAAAVPQIADASGRVDMRMTVRGTPREPRLRGALAVAGGRFRVVPAGVRYERLTMAARFRNETIVVDDLRVYSDRRGTLSAKGDIELPLAGHDGRVDLRAVADNFRVVDNRLAEGRVDADLTMTGSLAAPVLKGRVDTEGIVIKPPQGDKKQLEPLTFEHPGVHWIGEEPAAAGKQGRERRVRAAFLERARVDVRVAIDRNAWVRNDDMNIELRGRLRALKNPGEESLRVSGEINTVRGYYRLRGRRLDIDEGRLLFPGTEELNPLIDVSLSYEVPDYQIGAHVTGTTQKPNLTLSSTPPLEQGDILAVLIFGRPLDRLGAGEQAEMRDRVGQLLGGFAAEQLRRRFGTKLGLDTLEVTPGGADEGAQLGVGKYVSEDIFVEYVQRFGLEAASEVRLEYYFTRRWLVQTSTSTTGQSGVDVFWNVTF